MLALRQALRELRRRRLRSALTTGGIAIGVAALVLLGGLSEKMSRLVAGGRDFATGQVTVSGAGTGALSGMTRGGLLTAEQLQALERVDGVAAVAPIVMFPAADAPAVLPFTLAPLVFGVDVDKLVLNRRSPQPRVSTGRLAPAPASDEVVLGNQVARLYDVRLGDPITVRGQRFHVVGILEPTLTGPDSFVFMSFPTAQRLLIDSEPFLRRLLLVPGSNLLPIATAAAVFWATGEDAETVAARIRERLPGLSVVSPRDATVQLDRAVAFLNALIVGSGLVALLVASLAVTNTMFMAIVERRREIGLRRVVGATRRQVIAQLLVEATALGVVGSTLGLVAGALAVGGLNTLTERLGAAIFLVTPRLAIAAALLPAGLAAIAGLWPAWRAARLPPTEAVRYA
ncbi:MAG: ABC transporter permease [Deltaproteobacteria bacterium]|nr:MAG: ABC transporter permease [Deltaproteobacteria bacterium]